MNPLVLQVLLIGVPLAIGLWAQWRVQAAYRKTSAMPVRSGVTGAEAAAAVLHEAGIRNVTLESTAGELTDHYDPTRKALVLSEANFHGTGVAALAVAAHEAGHAIQDRIGYPMLRLRMRLVPLTQVSGMLLPFVILGGFFFKITGLIWLGIACYLVLLAFQLITLPVEFDASRRAGVMLDRLGLLTATERPAAGEMLRAAGWTYVAAFVATLGNLIYLVTSLGGGRDEE